MTGAIFYATRYGSTRQYARWIADAVDLPMFDIDRDPAVPSDYDFLIFAAPIIYHKLIGCKWALRHKDSLLARPVLLVSVSGARAGAKLDGWLADSLPAGLRDHAGHVALRGRQNPKDLTFYDRVMLIIGGLMNRDRKARREEMKGFDFMDASSITPVVAWTAQVRSDT